MADDSHPKTETQPEATTDNQTPTTEPQVAVDNKTTEGDGEKQNDTVQAPVTGEEAKNEKVEATETVKNEKEGGAKPSKQKDEKPRKNSKPRSRSNSMNRGATSKEWKLKGGEASKTLAVNSTISADAPPFVAKGTHDHSNDHAAEAIQGHVLQTPWTFWFSKKNKSKGKGAQGESEAGKEAATQAPEKDGEKEKAGAAAKGKKKKGQNENNNPTQVLTKVGTVQSVEEFWTYYSHLQRPSGLPKESNYCFFRYNDEPLWETYPKGCCFIVRLKKNGARLNQMWEELLFAAIGEAFDEPNVVGVVVSIRSKEDALSVWTRSNNKTIRTTLGEKLKELLELDRNSSLGFKTNQSSMKDKSTYKNAKKILLAS